MKEYFVYIMTNPRHTVLYTGVTNYIRRRAIEHAQHRGSRFTRKYNATEIVYYESFSDPEVAIRREKQIKGGSRANKIRLVEGMNPGWKNLLALDGIASSPRRWRGSSQ